MKGKWSPATSDTGPGWGSREVWTPEGLGITFYVEWELGRAVVKVRRPDGTVVEMGSLVDGHSHQYISKEYAKAAAVRQARRLGWKEEK